MPLEGISSPYAKYSNLRVDGRPIDVFLPAFVKPALTNTFFVFWLLVVLGERIKQNKLEIERRFRLNTIIQVIKHVLGLTSLLLVDAVIISLSRMAALYAYTFFATLFVLPLAIYYWRKLVIGLHVIVNLFGAKNKESVIRVSARKESDGDQVMLLRSRAMSDDSTEDSRL